MSEAEHYADCLRLVAQLTLTAARSLPIPQQIMAADGLHKALANHLPHEARAAAEIAEALRIAESRQSNFLELLTP